MPIKALHGDKICQFQAAISSMTVNYYNESCAYAQVALKAHGLRRGTLQEARTTIDVNPKRGEMADGSRGRCKR